MMRVVFGELKNYSKDIIPFGPWCCIADESLLDAYRKHFSQDAFVEQADFDNAEKLVSHLADTLFPELCLYLNQENHTDRSPTFWRVLVFPWLVAFLQNYIIQYFRFQRFILSQGTEFIFECTSGEVPQFSNTYDFYVNGLQSVEYLEWIYSDIIRQAYPQLNRKEYHQHPNPSIKPIPDKTTFSFRLRLLIKNLLGFKSIYGVEFKEAIGLSFLIKRKSSPNQLALLSLPKTNIRNAEELDIDWEELVKRSVPGCFLKIKQLATPALSLNYTFQLISGSLLYTEDEQKYQLARYVEDGGILIPVQHGSNYGVLSSFLNQKLVEYSYPGYISWGWNRHQGNRENATPLPSPLIQSFAEKHVTSNKDHSILLIGTTTSPLYSSIGSWHQPNQVLEYREEKVTFIEELTSEVFQRLKYRPYPVSTTQFKDQAFIEKHFPDVQICVGDLHPQLGKASLVVSDHPGTTFFITMGANVPSVGFWNPEHWHFTDEAESYFQLLREQKIIFDSPEEAARHINKIKNDIQGWWNQSEVQDARRKWSHQYARVSGNWKHEWKQYIKKMNEELLPV